MRLRLQTHLLTGIILMNSYSHAQPLQSKIGGVEAEWVIDHCRFTYQGRPVPLGGGAEEFTKVFGAASDSFIKPWPGHKPWKTYLWDNLGMQARPASDANPDKFGSVEISFLEPQSYKSLSPKRLPNGTSKIEFKPYGLIDSTSFKKILKEAFHHRFALQGEGQAFLDQDFGDGSLLSFRPLKDEKSNIYGLSVRYTPSPTSKYKTYPEAYAALDGSCLLPGAATKKAKDDSAEIEAGLAAGKRLKKAGAKNIADKLIENMGLEKKPPK